MLIHLLYFMWIEFTYQSHMITTEFDNTAIVGNRRVSNVTETFVYILPPTFSSAEQVERITSTVKSDNDKILISRAQRRARHSVQLICGPPATLILSTHTHTIGQIRERKTIIIRNHISCWWHYSRSDILFHSLTHHIRRYIRMYLINTVREETRETGHTKIFAHEVE